MKSMVKRNKYIFAFLLLCAAALSGALSLMWPVYKNRSSLDGLLAPVIVNIETAKPYMNNYSLIAEPDSREFTLAPTGTAQNELQNAVVYTEINGEYIHKLFVQYSGGEKTLAGIDNITVFIGNKTFYFPASVLQTLPQQESEDGMIFQLPLTPYAKSFIKPCLNWYGDLNFALKGGIAFLLSPFSFPAACVFLLCAVSLLWAGIKQKFDALLKKHGTAFELVLLVAVLVFAFLVRVDGLTRHSQDIDELYSSVVFANPHLPLMPLTL